MMRDLAVGLVGVVLMVGVGAPVVAQSAAPQTYSLIEDPGIPLMGPQVLTLTRDGSKEVVDQVMPVMTGRDKEYRGHVVYDFAAHKIYTQVLSDPGSPCSVMDYADAAAPPEFDPISGSAGLMKELADGADGPPKQIGTETLDGLTTKIMEVDSKGTKGKIWIADKGGFPLKVAMIGPDGKEQTLIEVKNLSFAKPAAAKLAPPTGCVAIGGVSSETGAHSADAKPSASVTAATLQPIAAYKGACPAHLKMVGTITTDGPGTVWYQFGAGSMEPGETLVFSAAGTKTVTHTMTFTVDPKYGNSMGGGAILQASMEDAKGNHDLAGTGSNNSDFSIECTGR